MGYESELRQMKDYMKENVTPGSRVIIWDNPSDVTKFSESIRLALAADPADQFAKGEIYATVPARELDFERHVGDFMKIIEHMDIGNLEGLMHSVQNRLQLFADIAASLEDELCHGRFNARSLQFEQLPDSEKSSVRSRLTRCLLRMQSYIGIMNILDSIAGEDDMDEDE
jgi:hypothetical protein